MAVQQTPSDILFEIRNSFYIGHYQRCCYEASKSKMSNKRQEMEKDIYYYRACIAQRRYGIAIKEIADDADEALIGIKMLALYLSSDVSKKAEVVAKVDNLVKKVNLEDNLSQFLLLMVGTIYFLEENYDGVLKLLHNTEMMEGCALVIQTYLKINRLDLAQKELNKMKEFDEDCTITQLCQGWINLIRGGEKLQDVFYIFQELADKYAPTPLLLSGQASALIAMGKYEEAEPILHNAINSDPDSPETLINLSVLSQYLGKGPEVSNRYLSQLEEIRKDHQFLQEFKNKEREFDRLAKKYEPTMA